jgi:ribosome biogenesis GTPase / thiamine phosphate phosphatase
MSRQLAEPSLPELTGTVLAVQANYYRVRLHTNAQQSLPLTQLLCTRRSRLKKIGQQVMVGDQVGIEEPDWMGGRGAIAQVLPRQTQLDRPSVANANQLLLVFALTEPILDPYQLSRFLVTAAATPLDTLLCLSKSDLVPLEDQHRWCDRLQSWGYQPLVISLKNQQGLTHLRAELNHKLTIISGPSGVGKSSLINALIPSLNLQTGAVSERWGRGRHTTRHVELFELPTGGLLADTPGFNQPSLSGNPSELASCFPEAQQRLTEEHCQFKDCLHRDEPNCVVRGDWERYEYYLQFLADLIAQQTDFQSKMGEEPTIKFKSGSQGRVRPEPKLLTKRYRRSARRTQQQALETLYQDVIE